MATVAAATAASSPAARRQQHPATAARHAKQQQPAAPSGSQRPHPLQQLPRHKQQARQQQQQQQQQQSTSPKDTWKDSSGLKVNNNKSAVIDDGVIHKTILLGDSGVGKTSLLIQFDQKKFDQTFSATVGIGFTNKIVAVDDMKVKLQIWDTAGQERFRSVTHAYYRDAHALLLLYDVTTRESFENIRAWLSEINEYAQEDVVIMLLGNKADMATHRMVKKEEGERLAREYNAAFMETSAKTGLNVELAFLAVAKKLSTMAQQQNQANRAASGEQSSFKFNITDYVSKESQQQPGLCCRMG